jgi:hypothetical protein
MNRGRGASQVEYLINLDVQGKRYIVAYKFKPGITQQMLDIAFAACKKIIHANDFVTVPQEAFAQVRAEKACAAGNQYPSPIMKFVYSHLFFAF